MGRLIDFNAPLSDEDKEYLRNRGRSSEIDANERQFAEGGEGADAVNPKFDTEARAQADYDVGGAPLPGSILDVDTGRVVPRQSLGDGVPDEGDVDDDIVDEVEALTVPELKQRLDKEKVEYESNAKKADLQDALAIHLHDKRHG
jgi:HeH/LEM domain